MRYISSRGKAAPVSSAEAIKAGIAPDGGLFVPGEQITVNNPERLINAHYRELAGEILKLFLPDYTDEELRVSINKAYSLEKFDNPEIAPVQSVSENMHFLELWHGPTCAFKDMALQILPHLLKKAMEKTGEKAEILILVATSGDTGKAALEGFRDVPGTRMVVFYPEEGVSEMQKRQMITQEGNNVHVVAVKGNFDDAQSGVKDIFADDTVRERMSAGGYKFSSANSINWGRLAPQIVYYFGAYLALLRNGRVKSGEPVNFVVPTGNFGNILAAYYAKQMGLPVQKLICASNQNNVLTEFINTGAYNRKRSFVRTISPSMDILISSNLERLLFEITGRDAGKITRWMDELNNTGSYSVDSTTAKTVKDLFWSDYADDTATVDTIKQVYKDYNYTMDPHTAVGAAVYKKYLASANDTTKTVIVSTASPFKFNESVAQALINQNDITRKTEFELLELLAEKTGQPIPRGLRNLDQKPVLHEKSTDINNIKKTVLSLI